MIDSKDHSFAWEARVSRQSAHLEEGELISKKTLFAIYKKAIGEINLENKTIIDFGCGGGFAGLYLYKKIKIKQYVGIDIAARSIQAAKKRLDKFDPQLMLIDPNIIPDLNIGADAFLSFACIQHCPDQQYLDYLLEKINGSNCRYIILSVKYMPTNTFRDEPYKTTHDIGNACFTNAKYITSKLKNYKLKYKSRAENGEYQYIRLERIGIN